MFAFYPFACCCAKLQQKILFTHLQIPGDLLLASLAKQNQRQRLHFNPPFVNPLFCKVSTRAFAVKSTPESLLQGNPYWLLLAKHAQHASTCFAKTHKIPCNHSAKNTEHLQSRTCFAKQASKNNKFTEIYKTKERSIFSLAKSLQDLQNKQGKEKSHLRSAEKKSSFYKTLQSKCLAINAINSCVYMGPSSSMFNPSSVWSPSMYDFLQGHRENHGIFAYEKTAQKFLESLHLCALIRRKGGSIYVIFDQDGGTSHLDPMVLSNRLSAVSYRPVKKTRFSDKPCKRFADYETPYGWSSEKWVGGTFSNFQQVSKSVSLYGTLSRQFFRFLQQNKNVSSRYTAMHLQFRGNVLSQTADSCKRFQSFLHQYKGKNSIDLCFKNNPDVIIVENANKNRNVIQEAHALNIPVISFADSDVAEAVLSKISIVIGINIYKRSFFYSLLYYIYKIPVSK